MERKKKKENKRSFLMKDKNHFINKDGRMKERRFIAILLISLVLAAGVFYIESLALNLYVGEFFTSVLEEGYLLNLIWLASMLLIVVPNIYAIFLERKE